MSHCEIQHLQKRRDDEEALKGMQAVYPQCAECSYHFKIAEAAYELHVVVECCNAMRHANELLSRMNTRKCMHPELTSKVMTIIMLESWGV